jgi:hypothetical protein
MPASQIILSPQSLSAEQSSKQMPLMHVPSWQSLLAVQIEPEGEASVTQVPDWQTWL